MKMFTIVCVSVVCLMGGMAMPTDLGRGAVTTVTSGQSEEPCVWQSDIPVNNLTDLLDGLNAVKPWAHIAFNTTCWALIRQPEDLCPFLKDEASEDGYLRFDPQGKDTCDVQEVIREASRVINKSIQMIGKLSDDVTKQLIDSDVTSDLARLISRLDLVDKQLDSIMGDSTLPPAVATIATDGDRTAINERNVKIPAYVAVEVDKIITVISSITDQI